MTATRNLTERLDRLERQNRNLKRGLGGIVLTAAALLLAPRQNSVGFVEIWEDMSISIVA